MDSEPEQLTCLRSLASELQRLKLQAELCDTATAAPYLTVTSQEGAPAERISCRPGPGQSWQFCWAWNQPVGPATGPAAAARQIAEILRPVAAAPATAAPAAPLNQAAPNAARIYDWLLGGKDHYAADRQAAKRLLRAVPGARKAALDNRAFLARAVRYLAAQGITQFLDIGSGLPAAGPVHEVARETCPAARVAYVDHDPVVVAHARAILAMHDPGLDAVQADLRRPLGLLTDPAVRDVIDFARPVGLLLIAVLHFIADADRPHDIVRALAARLAPGSYVVISHVTADDLNPGAALAARAAYNGASAPVAPRSREDVERFLDGLDPVPPGVTDVRAWHRPAARPRGPVLFWAGTGRVPGPRGPEAGQ